MPTRDDIQFQMMKIYDDHSRLFKEVKLERIKFLQWVDGFEDFNDLRKAFTYITHKLIPALQAMKTIWSYKSADAWTLMKSQMGTHPDVLTLRKAEFTIKEVWQNRPKARRLS